MAKYCKQRTALQSAWEEDIVFADGRERALPILDTNYVQCNVKLHTAVSAYACALLFDYYLPFVRRTCTGPSSHFNHHTMHSDRWFRLCSSHSLTHSFTYSTVGYEIHTVRLYHQGHQQHPQSNRNDNNANAVDGTDALPCLALPSNHRIAL